MLVKVWLYAFARGIRSSRKVEEALHEDVAFRMLSGNQQPDHWTLSEFRWRHLKALGDLLFQTVELAQAAGMVKLGQVAIDGTKVKAYASKRAAMSYGRMEKEVQRPACCRQAAGGDRAVPKGGGGHRPRGGRALCG